MPELTEALNRIKDKFQAYVPYCIDDLGHGLSVKAIDEMVRDLPFKLPSELYELYQWHDGLSNWTFLFENYNFLSLKRAVYEYRGEVK